MIDQNVSLIALSMMLAEVIYESATTLMLAPKMSNKALYFESIIGASFCSTLPDSTIRTYRILRFSSVLVGFWPLREFNENQTHTVAHFKRSRYREGYKLTGIIYMHRISDIRVGGISRRTFNVFRKLCGKDSLSNVLLVTNMWSDPPTSEQLNRENELRTHADFFLPAIEQGATMVRRTHKNQQSAHSIIRMLLEKNPITMQVQEELVVQRKALSDTGAGREVEHELIMAAEKHKAEMSELKTEMEEALKDRDERTQKELAQYQLDAKAAEEKRQSELAALRKGYDDEQVRWQQQAEEARAQQKAMEEATPRSV
ncbi:hypothetical protein AG1IA_07113 [Rhizoctonia solani AG-1 IA]|uniref:Uncharacterized protein n=1 Tax=Thanatephorus cucumeris (strain AG1-IA) TaxID=983506 RepID=L8WL16_THACA|nr:hypothetical protein AG1IA_07113 [Rhizoctonia solani AG-1 IA]